MNFVYVRDGASSAFLVLKHEGPGLPCEYVCKVDMAPKGGPAEAENSQTAAWIAAALRDYTECVSAHQNAIVQAAKRLVEANMVGRTKIPSSDEFCELLNAVENAK